MSEFRWNGADIEFPLTKEQVDAGKAVDAVSAIVADDEERIHIHPKDMPKPLMPEDGAEFWSDFLEVALRVQLARKKTPFAKIPKELKKELLPEVLKDKDDILPEVLKNHYKIRTAFDLAQLVRADWPTDIMSKLAEWLYSKGYKERDFFGYKHKRFTDGPVLLAKIIGDVIHSVSPTAFAHKYYFGRPRPQMVAGAWARGELKAPEGIEVALNQAIDKERILRDEKLFGIYPAPNHPSLPAMHAAVASIHLIFSVWFELDDYGFDQCKRLSAAVGLGRDFAGVHYRHDTLYGMALGERCVQKALPGILAQHGIDPKEVEKLLEGKLTDWTKDLPGYKAITPEKKTAKKKVAKKKAKKTKVAIA